MVFFLSTVGVSIALLWVTFRKSSKGYYSPTLLSITATMQVFVSNLLIFLDEKALVNNSRHLIYFKNVFDTYIYVCIFFQVIVLFAVLLRETLVGAKPRTSMKEFLDSMPSNIPIYYAWLGLFLIALYPFNVFLPSVPAYFLRLSLSIFVLSPILAGYFFFRSTILFNVCWIFILILFTGWNYTTGGRGHATLFLVYYVVGMWFGAPSGDIRKRIAIIVLLCIYPFTVILGTVGNIRDEIGRISTENINRARIELFLSTFSDRRASTKDDRSLVDAVYRLVNWANPAVVYLTPEKVEYRYFSSIPDELSSIFDISILSGKTPEQKRKEDIEKKLGTAAANDYGFRVTVANSVEFGVIADAWSRLGAWGLFITTFAMVNLLLWIESLMIDARRIYPAFSLVVQFYFLSAVFSEFGSVPVTYFLRELILNCTFLFVVTAILRPSPRAVFRVKSIY